MSEHLGHEPADDDVLEQVWYDGTREGALVDDGALAGHGMAARFGAELLGSFLLVLGGLGVALWAVVTDVGVLGVALAFGLALVVALVAFGHVSGGHFNPVVTLGAAVAGRTAWGNVLPYWLAQVLGGAMASGVLLIVAKDNVQIAADDVESIFRAASNTYGAASPVQFGLLAATVLEMLVAGVFVAVVLAVTSRRARTAVAAPVIGIAFTLGLLVLAPVTGGSLNPARSLASALFAGSEVLGQVWLFALAPLLGAAIGAMLYALLQPVEEVPVLAELIETDADLVADGDTDLGGHDRGEDGEEHTEAQERGHVEGA